MNFEEQLNKFVNKIWKRPEENSFVSFIKKNKVESKEELKELTKSNDELINLVSFEFKKEIDKLTENKINKMKVILEKKIGYDNWEVLLTDQKELIARKKNSLKEHKGFIGTNGFPQWDNYFSLPIGLRESVEKFYVDQYLEEDQTTADISNIEQPVSLVKFYEDKNIEDVYNGEDEEEVDVTPKTFNESVQKIYKNGFVLINENFTSARKNLECIVESKGNIHRVLIPKSSFIEFLKENAMCDDYINKKGDLEFNEFMEDRNLGLKNEYLKEFINNEIEISKTDTLEIQDTEIEGDSITVHYLLEEEPGEITLELKPLIDFVMEEDFNASLYNLEMLDGEEIFNEESYFNNADTANETIKQFLILNELI